MKTLAYLLMKKGHVKNNIASETKVKKKIDLSTPKNIQVTIERNQMFLLEK